MAEGAVHFELVLLGQHDHVALPEVAGDLLYCQNARLLGSTCGSHLAAGEATDRDNHFGRSLLFLEVCRSSATRFYGIPALTSSSLLRGACNGRSWVKESCGRAKKAVTG